MERDIHEDDFDVNKAGLAEFVTKANEIMSEIHEENGGFVLATLSGDDDHINCRELGWNVSNYQRMNLALNRIYDYAVENPESIDDIKMNLAIMFIEAEKEIDA